MKIIPYYHVDVDDLIANTFILYDEDNNCVIIDPSKDNDEIINRLNKDELKPKAILLTHGHFDHIRGVKRLIDKYHIPVYIGFEEVDFLNDPTLNCSRYMSGDYVLDIKPITVSDGEVLKILKEDIICIHTPFHTIGSYCFYFEKDKLLFSGDTLFRGSVGRWDLPTGSHKTIKSSMEKIVKLPDETRIFTGHGPATILKTEKEENPFLQ